MKKFISVIILMLFMGLNSLFAQQTNQVILEGDLSFTSTSSGYVNSDDKHKTSTYKFSPSIGIMLSNKVALGGFLEYHSTTSNESNSNDGDTRTLHYGVYTRIHFTLKEKLVMYIQPRLSSSKYLGDNTPDNYFNINIGTGAGLLYFITPKFGLNLVLGNINYSYITLDGYNGKFTVDDFTFETVLNSPKLGVSFYL